VQKYFPKLKDLNDNDKESEATIELLTSLSMHDAALVEEGAPLQPPMLGSKMMRQDRQAKKGIQEDIYDLVQIEDGKSEASKLYKGPATRWCRIERIEILEGDRQVPILPAPAHLGNNANANIELKIHGDPVATSMKLLVWAQEACDPSAADEATPGFRKVHTSSIQFWPAGCHGNPKSGLENFKFDVLGVQKSTSDAQSESSDGHSKPSASTDTTQLDITVRPDGVLEELNFNDPSQHESEDREHPEIIMTFDTHGGIGHQLDIGCGKLGSSPANLTSESQDALAACRVLEINGRPFKARVTLRIPHGFGEKKDMQTVDALKKLRDQKHPFPWSAYCAKTKNPLTQYGMFATRKHIVDAYGGIVKVDAQCSFNSIQEWQIMQTNAAHLDYQFEKQKIQKINEGSHQISFYKVAGETVLASVQLQENGSSDQYRIAPGSSVTLSWTQPADRQKGMLRCNGTVMENVFGIPGQQMIVALGPVRPRERIFLHRSTSINDLDRPRYAVRVTVKIDTTSIKHRVDAINKISCPEMERFHAAIIAQKTSSHEPIDPIKEASGHQALGRKVYEDVLNDSLFAWNEDQKNCFYMARALPGGIAINEGVPGSGKSRLICGLTKMFSALKNRRGMNSVCTLIEVPTNAAGDAIYSAFTHFSTLSGTEASCIRVYTQTNENRAFLNKGQTSTSSAEEEAANDIVSATMIQVIATLRKNHESSRYKLEEHSLEAHIIRLAENAADNEGNACARFVRSRVLRNISDSLVNPLPYLDKLPTDPDELFQVDLYPMILGYIKRMQAAHINEWEDKSHIRLAKAVFGWVMEDVLAYTQVVIATPYCCGGDTFAKSFGEKFDHIMIIEDETMRQTEIDTLLPLGKLRHSEKILGLILCGDTKQPRPFAISATGGDERVNEFGHQLTYPLGRRLIDAYHPQTAQWEQNRMLPILAEFPNKYTYARMTNSPVACAQVVNANWDSMMTHILGRRHEPNNYIVLSIHGSESFTTPGHTSRKNPVHAEYIVYLVLQNYKANGYKPSEILVVTYYTEQVRLIGELFLKVVEKGLIAPHQIPAVMTTAQSQGHQAQWILGDAVVHNAEVKRDLGFVGTQESLCNVFLTRAKTAFTGFVHRDIGSGQVAREDKSKREIIAFVQDASKRNAIVDITQRPQELAFLGVQTLAEIEATVATPDQADNNSWDQEQGQDGKEQPAVQEDIVGGDGADWGVGDAAEDGTDGNEGTGNEWSTTAY